MFITNKIGGDSSMNKFILLYVKIVLVACGMRGTV